jgi:hypothetical protein
MSTYKEIFGKYVRSVGSDPSAAVGEGEIWYNTSSNTFKSSVRVAAWSSGNNLNTARSYIAGGGTQNAALGVGGYVGPPSGVRGNTEEYNGTSWSEQADLGTTRYSTSRGLGTQTAFIAAGGNNPSANPVTNSELYNGSSWTATNALNTARSYLSGFGTSTAGLVVGGANPRPSAVNNSESFDGTNWTANPATPFTVKNGATAGPATAGVFAGGAPGGPPTSTTASYEINSTTWTTGNSLNVGRNSSGFGGQGATQTAAWLAGGLGTPSTTTATEHYDGTSWTTAAVIATARGSMGGAGTQSLGLIFGGGPDTGLAATEEYSDVAAVKTLTTS